MTRQPHLRNLMSRYQRTVFPLLSRMDAEEVHERTLRALALAQSTAPGRAMLRRIAGKLPSQPVPVFGLTFPNVLGVAAGFDKDVRVPAGLALLGFGHIEVGTITPWPQAGNPQPRIFRLPEDRALVNRMGFPNGGMVAATRRLRQMARSPRSHIIGVSLGKQKETPLAEAAQDYVSVMRAVFPYADYLAVNISSPNTPGLRQLQGGRYLYDLLHQLMAENRNLAFLHRCPTRPLLVKIAPDLTWPELDTILQAALDNHIAGVIATNTTLSREGTTHPAGEEAGGLSGAPLEARSNEIIAYIQRQTASRLPVIGVGGVQSAAGVQAKLAAGATLVQVYTGLVYGGPGFAGRVLRELAGVTTETTTAAT
ncbi:MAG: quinone-dependent dihydroorotate dehydrogenase [Ardenticatenaceae bacterium]|nr:quinone-dependent dihydroorotate dehydrogenase [Ardenticatenaceae bacterium]